MSRSTSQEALAREIESLLTSFGRFADAGDGTALSQLFFPDGELRAGEQRVVGREAIANLTSTRAADPQRKTRHTWSNLHVEVMSDGTLRANSIQQTYEQRGSDAPAQCRVSDLTDRFAKDAKDQWRFQSRHINPVFTTG